MCKAMFTLTNCEYYERPMVIAALNTLLGRGADIDGSITAAVRHSRWHHVEQESKVRFPFFFSHAFVTNRVYFCVFKEILVYGKH